MNNILTLVNFIFLPIRIVSFSAKTGLWANLVITTKKKKQVIEFKLQDYER